MSISVAAAIAPSFADDTGDAQSWMMGTAITAITVPAASGTPHAYLCCAVGTLPAGLAFNTTTRVISGTPTATGFGTITIRATNSEGDADWTVDYTTTAPASAPSRPAAATLTVDSDTQITAVGVAPNDGGDTITSYDWRYRTTSPLGPWIARSNQTNLTQVFSGLAAEQGYRFQFRATNSVGDSSYSPSANATTRRRSAHRGLCRRHGHAHRDPSITVTRRHRRWAAKRGRRTTAITPVTVPAASGNDPHPPTRTSGGQPGTLPGSHSTPRRALSPALRLLSVLAQSLLRCDWNISEGDDDWTGHGSTITSYDWRHRALHTGSTGRT